MMDPGNVLLNPNPSEPPGDSCQAASNNDDMPSLDVLSFDREPCTSPNCQCRVGQYRRDKNTNSSLPPFSYRTGLHPPLKRPIASSSGYVASSSGTANGHYTRLVSPPMFGVPVYSSSLVTNSSSTERLAKEKRLDVPANGTLFGAEHYERADFRSFSQLGSGQYPEAGATPVESSEAFRTTQPPSFDPRTSSFGESPARELDLRDLQSVLEDSIEAVPDRAASCPVHLQPPSSSGRVHPCTCAQQAAKFDDWTGDELAGYFDDFCYIPKKMSAMAEMMYM
jgi:hypothetical protein